MKTSVETESTSLLTKSSATKQTLFFLNISFKPLLSPILICKFAENLEKTKKIMRRLLVIGVVLVCLFSCSNENEITDEQSTVLVSASNTRTVEEAVAIANEAIKMLEGDSITRVTSREVDRSTIKAIVSTVTRSGNGVDTLLYVINYKDNNGFAVVSANKATEGLLAVTENGSYEESMESNDNVGFSDFMKVAKSYVSLKIDTTKNMNFDEITQTKEQTDTIDMAKIAAKVTLQWGQGSIIGQYCPNGIAGCANVAMSQIMSYFCYPTSIALTYKGANEATLNLNWKDIKRHIKNHIFNIYGCTAEGDSAIGKLHRQLGLLNKSTYKTDYTSTYDKYARNTFINLGYYVSALKKYDGSNFYSPLSNGKLIYMRGTGTDSNGEEIGHAWVVDGCNQFTVRHRTWTKKESQLDWVLQTDKRKTYKYIHINWGFNGDSNGYFSTGVFETNKGTQYDSYSHTVASFTSSLYYFEVSH